jgi:integrase
MDSDLLTARNARSNPASQSKAAQEWSARYGQRHRLQRIMDCPNGITLPRRVRIYRRVDHFVLQWWDRQAKGNLCIRVDGDLVTAIMRAREIEDRLENFRTAGLASRRSGHRELADKFLTDLDQRANAGEIDPATVSRYRSALQHYLLFVANPSIEKSFPHATTVTREFQLAFAAFLQDRHISSNGHVHTKRRPMKGQAYVTDTVRAMFEWAADPDRGHLLPQGFRNPFRQRRNARRHESIDQTSEPDITVAMAVNFLQACDAYQLGIFAPIIMCGLRAAEPCFLFREYIEDRWLKVPCNPELFYQTKGRRAKRFPWLDEVGLFLQPSLAERSHGLLYQGRRFLTATKEQPFLGASLKELTDELQRRCRARPGLSARERIQLRDQLLLQAGGLTYDQVQGEFHKIAKKLAWPRSATLKDFRHLFSTCLENAGMPEHYRKYLMGHSPGKAPINAYTHLNKLREHYELAIQREFQPLLDALRARARQLGIQGT